MLQNLYGCWSKSLPHFFLHLSKDSNILGKYVENHSQTADLLYMTVTPAVWPARWHESKSPENIHCMKKKIHLQSSTFFDEILKEFDEMERQTLLMLSRMDKMDNICSNNGRVSVYLPSAVYNGNHHYLNPVSTWEVLLSVSHNVETLQHGRRGCYCVCQLSSCSVTFYICKYDIFFNTRLLNNPKSKANKHLISFTKMLDEPNF